MSELSHNRDRYIETSSDVLEIGKGAYLLRGFAQQIDAELITLIQQISSHAPFRQMTIPRGFKMAVSMTNCGQYGWVSDEHGYRYDSQDPLTHQVWPSMPELFIDLASAAANAVGQVFIPDACLINRYQPTMRMGLHQDKDELDLTAPIVSISLGLSAIFQLGGIHRKDKTSAHLLKHADVLILAGDARHFYHGIAPIKLGFHPLTGQFRYNLTFRLSH